MSYRYHLPSAAGYDSIWANLCLLADVAASVKEKHGQVSKKRKLKSDMNTLSEKKDSKSSKTKISPDFDVSKSSGKRCLAVKERKVPVSKKAKVTWIGKETPEWLLQLMADMNGTELKLILEKSLFETDVNRGEGRLSMPYNKLIVKDFMTASELKISEDDIKNTKKTGIETLLVDQQKQQWKMRLKRWEMPKKSGNGSWSYVLTFGWNKVVEANEYKEGQNISIWSFRVDGALCFALATPPTSTIMAQTSSSCL